MDRVWGEHELGGTSVLYLSDVDLGIMGWPQPEAEPIPALTEPIIAKTPAIGLSVMGSILGINWVIRRRMRLAAEAAGEFRWHGQAETAPSAEPSALQGDWDIALYVPARV